MDDISFLEAISDSVSRGWIIRRPRQGPWIGARPRGPRLPAAGWKLHVSATTQSAAEVLDRALPILLEEGAAFKVAAALSVVTALNEGEGGISQIGKFITVYPRDEAQALRLAAALHEATAGLRGPRVETDRELHAGSLVHYRYGAFVGRPEDAEPSPPAVDPFLASGVADAPTRGPIAGRYVVVSTLHRSASGSVLLAADVEAGEARVLKRAGRDSRVGPDGLDARDRLRHEASVLERLASDPRVPAVHDLVEVDGDLYLVLEHLDGHTLGSLVTGPCDEGRTLAWARELLSMLRMLHRAGLVYRDLNPLNVFVSAEGSLRLVDFELACVMGSSGPAAGTPGYCSPQQMAGAPASEADDVYGLGAMLHFLSTGTDPGTVAPRAPVSGLERAIARCLDEDPDRRRPSLEEMDLMLAELQATA